ncbi:hypothetical protein ABMA32_05915 [Mesorhizobium sp. VNQ89]|uniref:hypothetical protein n=1 Tax=Mesorhizobium quangtriensis TaxID=3157709 RepID=UPI0032B8365E
MSGARKNDPIQRASSRKRPFANQRAKVAVFLLLVLFASTAWLEARVFLSIPGTAGARFNAIIHDEIPAGISPYSQRVFLDECVEAMDGYYGRLQPPERRDALASICEQHSLRYTAWTPTFAYAWYVAARSALQKGDREQFLERIGKAYETAPSEGWMAAFRLPVWNENDSALTPEMRKHFTRDIELLLQTKSGAVVLVRYTARYPDLRERLIEMVSKTPPSVQRQFLAAMRDALELGRKN